LTLHYDFQCMKILDLYVSNLFLKVLVSLAITTQFGKLFHMSTTLLVKQYLHKSYLKRVLVILSH